jgi:hypothetical protein
MTSMHLQNRPKYDAMIFANGPYQLLVGLACARRHIGKPGQISVVLYDMKWQPALFQTCRSFSQFLNLEIINFAFEWEKSTISNTHTYPGRSLLNHLTFFISGLFNPCPNIFLPKLYGSPERAIILSSINKKIYIYDDGYGMYVDPVINQNKIDKWLYKYIDRFFSNKKSNITICPRKPELMDYEQFHDIRISREDYSRELRDIFVTIANQTKFRIRESIHLPLEGKKTILVALPRLAFANQNEIIGSLHELIHALSMMKQNVTIFIKPHPRDLPADLLALEVALKDEPDWELLPSFTTPYPIEILSLALDASIILSGFSTVGMNADVIPGNRVLVFDFLSFNIPHYNDFARRIMVKAGGYAGATVQEAVEKIRICLEELKK